MQPEKLDEMLREYRTNKARVEYLDAQLAALREMLDKAKGSMVSDCVSLSQAITGMPHGSGTGDPVAKLAIRLANGDLVGFAKDVQEEITMMEAERTRVAAFVQIVDIALAAMNDREREVFSLKVLDKLGWIEVLESMNKAHENAYSKRSLQRLFERAQSKAYAVVA